MKRREFITLVGGAAAWPLGVRAQQGERIRRIGMLMSLAEDDPEDRQRRAAFQQALRQLGWTEGGNLRIDYRWYGGDLATARALAKELVELEPDLIVATATPALTALALQMRPIPIVFVAVSDPVGQGFVASLARPGGNATGINFFNADITAKRLGLLHDLVPKATRIAALVNPGNASSDEAVQRDLPEAARAIGLQVELLNASTSREIEAAFAAMLRDRADALLVTPDGFFTSRRVQLATFAARYGIPSAHSSREEVEAGALMSYGPDLLDVYRQGGAYTGQILKGAKPADLPVLRQPNSSSSSTCRPPGYSASRCQIRSNCSPTRSSNNHTAFAALHESAAGRFCCKSLFALAIKNSFGRRRDFRVKMWGTSSPEDKLTGDLRNVIEATSIGGRRSDFFTARKLARGNLGLLQQYRH
jgi:putative tryptophan/tyrosine transport system substrate-binding protein